MNVTHLKSSSSHPLRIDSLAVPNTAGLLGLTICPGKRGKSLFGGVWARDLETDLQAIAEWRASAVVTLLEDHEFQLLQVEGLGSAVTAMGIEWLHAPIRDVDIPGDEFMAAWGTGGAIGERLRILLSGGERVLLHCRGGLGRTGTLAGMLLMEFGLSPDQAIRQVRQAREGAIETPEQERFLHRYRPRPWRRTPGHYAACLLGGAIGDALGGAVEFTGIDDIRSQFGAAGIRAYSESYDRLGAITDDTQMTLFTAEGLLRGQQRFRTDGRSSLVIEEVLRAYWRWLLTQGRTPGGRAEQERGGLIEVDDLHAVRAPGQTCLSALESGEVGVITAPINTSKGCGAVMRAAPVGLFLQAPEMSAGVTAEETDAAIFQLGCDLGALTHGHPSGYLPAGCLALLVGRLVDGDDLDTAAATVLRVLATCAGYEETRHALRRAMDLAGNPAAKPTPEAVASLGEGWVGEEALAIGFYCARVAAGDFDVGVRLAVNHSGDSDSTGSIAGNLLGLMGGMTALDDKWLGPLELREVIEEMGRKLYAVPGA